jgi:hypothetical protein
MNFLSTHARLPEPDNDRAGIDTIPSETGQPPIINYNIPNITTLNRDNRIHPLHPPNSLDQGNDSFSNQDFSIDFLHNNLPPTTIITNANSNNNNNDNNLNNVDVPHIQLHSQVFSESNQNNLGMSQSNINESQLINQSVLVDPAVESNVREIIYAVLKFHTIGFFLFILLVTYLKFGVSYYYTLVFLWLVDIYGIVSSVNTIAENSETEGPHKLGHMINILEHFLMIILKILIIISFEAKAFSLIVALSPYILIFLVRTIYAIYQRKVELSFILNFFFAIQVMNVSLRLDNIVDWDWREVFWSYWVVFSVMIGITFAMFLLLVSKCATYLFADTNRYELRGVFWLFCIFTGGTSLSCAFVVTFIDYLETTSIDSINQLALTIYIIIGYCLFITIITLTYLRDIEKFLQKLAPSEEPQQNSDKKKNEQKVPEKIDIPKFLLKISSTYFGRATETDIKEGQTPLSANNKKKPPPKKLHLRTASFDYSKLTKNSEVTQETQRGDTNLMTIPSARSKEEDVESHSARHHPKALIAFPKAPKALLELLDLRRLTGNNNNHQPLDTDKGQSDQFAFAQKTLSETSRRIQTETDRLDGGVTDASNAPMYPVNFEPIRSDDAAGLKQIFENLPTKQTEKLMKPPKELVLNMVGKLPSPRKKNHRRIQSEVLMMKPRMTVVDETNDELNRTGPHDCSIVSNQSKHDAIPEPPLSPNDNTNRSVSACLICFDKAPDAVFMECGHGGICYECSLEVWKATNECYLCRKPITQVLQLDLKNMNKSKVIKVLSSTQMVTYDQEEEDKEEGNSGEVA